MTETQLRTVIEATSRRDTDAFRTLYDYLESRVFAYVVYRTPGREVAIDVTQDVFVSLYQSLTTFVYQSEAQFYSYVFTLVRRHVAKYYADKHTMAAKNLSTLPEELLVDETATNSDELAVRQSLEQLDDIARDIVVLHHWSRYTFGEIAAMLSMSESAVRTRHHRALQTLKSLFVLPSSV